MAYTRQEIYTIDNGTMQKGSTTYWYAVGVQQMQTLPIATETSWKFYAAIHGIDKPYWEANGYLSQSDTLPSQAIQRKYWNKCTHGIWWFFPWHRGYLLSIESLLRSLIIAQSGPADWALPYWNYYDNPQLPPAFASQQWPGEGDNPLYIVQRYGPNGDGNVFIPAGDINLNALQVPYFVGSTSGSNTGFGGVDSGPVDHHRTIFGQLEQNPHNIVHVEVGGSKNGSNNSNDAGLMATVPASSLDPIFYLHHANIDRLWDSWLAQATPENAPNFTNPADPTWLNQEFVMPYYNGETSWNYNSANMIDPQFLDYTYDTVVPATNSSSVEVASALPRTTGMVLAPKSTELIGASREALNLSGTDAHKAVHLDKPGIAKVSTSFRALSLAPTSTTTNQTHDRIYLNLENMTGSVGASILDVYVGLPENATPPDHPELKAGTIGLFGISQASDIDGEHGGAGQNHILDITEIVYARHLNDTLDVASLHVSLVPRHPLSEEAPVKVGRISIYRESY